ncbi:MAG: hypothetical protein B7Z02_11500 [Rhodobacterales bacterium 32-67-9]|nr:MAG: hypothetical protein B7Z02_11500 [Rhodobacterales bacterium 32-67-9]
MREALSLETHRLNEAAETAGRLRFAISGYIPSFFEEMADHGLIDIEGFFDTGGDHADAA